MFTKIQKALTLAHSQVRCHLVDITRRTATVNLKMLMLNYH